jgi:VanZ family protein
MGWIVYLSQQSSRPAFADEHQVLAHAALYAALAVLTFIAMPPSFRNSRSTLVALVVFGMVMAFAVTDELHQAFVPNRTASVADLVADAVGASAGVTIASAIAGAFARRTERLASRD